MYLKYSFKKSTTIKNHLFGMKNFTWYSILVTASMFEFQKIKK